MQKINLGQAIHTLANVGVIAGIFFLGVEISQNNDELASQSRNTMYQMRSNLSEPFIHNRGGIADLLAKYGRGESLTETERRRIVARRANVLETLAYMFEENPEAVSRRPGSTAAILSGDPGFSDFWDTDKVIRDPEFVKWMEELVIPRIEF